MLAPMIAVLTISACAAYQRHAASGGAAIDNAAAGVAGVVAHTESAERNVQSAKPHADPVGGAQLDSASAEHAAVLDEASKIGAELKAARESIRSLSNDVEEQIDRYKKLEARWFVRWGRWIERALWIIGLSWLGLGIASIVFGLGNPLGWAFRIGKEISRALPFMNVFSWIRDGLVKRRSRSNQIAARLRVKEPHNP